MLLNLCVLLYAKLLQFKGRGQSATHLPPTLIHAHTLCSIYRFISQSTLEHTFSCPVLKCVYTTEVHGR